jgi:hypothetical protein
LFVLRKKEERNALKPEWIRITELCEKVYGGSEGVYYVRKREKRKLGRVQIRFVRVRLVKVLSKFLGMS